MFPGAWDAPQILVTLLTLLPAWQRVGRHDWASSAAARKNDKTYCYRSKTLARRLASRNGGPPGWPTRLVRKSNGTHTITHKATPAPSGRRARVTSKHAEGPIIVRCMPPRPPTADSAAGGTAGRRAMTGPQARRRPSARAGSTKIEMRVGCHRRRGGNFLWAVGISWPWTAGDPDGLWRVEWQASG